MSTGKPAEFGSEEDINLLFRELAKSPQAAKVPAANSTASASTATTPQLPRTPTQSGSRSRKYCEVCVHIMHHIPEYICSLGALLSDGATEETDGSAHKKSKLKTSRPGRLRRSIPATESCHSKPVPTTRKVTVAMTGKISCVIVRQQDSDRKIPASNRW